MPDNIVLSNVPRPQASWFSGAPPLQVPISQAMTALEKGANNYTLASVAPTLQPASTPLTDAAAAPVSAEITAPEDAIAQEAMSSPSSTAQSEELDAELMVASLLDEISSVMEDINESRMAADDHVVDVVTALFHDIARHIDDIPHHLASEVGEVGADICGAIEAKGTSVQPIIAFFNP